MLCRAHNQSTFQNLSSPLYTQTYRAEHFSFKNWRKFSTGWKIYSDKHERGKKKDGKERIVNSVSQLKRNKAIHPNEPFNGPGKKITAVGKGLAWRFSAEENGVETPKKPIFEQGKMLPWKSLGEAQGSDPLQLGLATVRRMVEGDGTTRILFIPEGLS